MTSRNLDPPLPLLGEPCRDEPGDGRCCRAAVQRAYRELREKQQSATRAFDAALTVYQWHHPKVPMAEALAVVADWVRETTRH